MYIRPWRASIMFDGYNAYVFIGDELKSAMFKDTEHWVCRSIRKVENRTGERIKLSERGGQLPR